MFSWRAGGREARMRLERDVLQRVVSKFASQLTKSSNLIEYFQPAAVDFSLERLEADLP